MNLPRKQLAIFFILITAICVLMITIVVVMRISTDRVTPGRQAVNLNRSMRVEDRFAGSASCAECHESISKQYQTHPMSHSMSSLEEPGIEERKGLARFSTTSGCDYLVERKEKSVLHREIRRDPQGEVIYDQAVEVTYSIGSGLRGKGYLIERDDLLFMSPISWYAGEDIWGLSPGYSAERHPRFERRITDACLNCHAGRVAHRAGEPDRYPTPKFLELSIGCERCHGPGQQHIDIHRKAGDGEPTKIPVDRQHETSTTVSTSSPITDPIVNPSKLDTRRREAICNGCHLTVEHNHLRYGRSHLDFRPGQDLEDIVTAFIEAEPRSMGGSSSRAVSQVTQMRESRCYQSSDDRFGCTSCHDPHRVPAEGEKLSHYRERCLNCHHAQACMESIDVREASASDSCITCHMPKLSAEDVPHTSQTDHRIPRRLAPNKATGELSPSDTLQPFDEWDRRLSSVDTNRAWGLMYAAESEKKNPSQQLNATNAEQRLKLAISERPDDIEVLGSLASVYLTMKRRADARRILQNLVDRDPLNEFGLIQMALLLHAEEDWTQSLRFWDKAIERNPWIALNHVQHGQTLVKARKIDEAITAAYQALDQNPGFLPAHVWLSQVLPQVGRVAEGERHQKMVIRLRSQ